MFAKNEVRYLIIGGYAAMHYSQPRLTKDLDLWIDPSPENAARVLASFQEFGMPLIDVTPEDFEKEGLQYMIGRSPVLFDFLTTLPGFKFSDCWNEKTTDREEDFEIQYLSISHLIQAKEEAGRPQDLSDLDEIRRAQEEN